MASTTIETTHAGIGLAPVADAFSGTVNSDVFSMENYGLITFYVHWGVGTTGTTLITVQACDDFTPTTTSAKAFSYKIVTSPDTQGALQAATSSGFTTTAGSNQIYQIEVEAAALGSDGPCVRLNCVEQANAALLGGIIAIQSQPRYAHDQTVVSSS